MLVPDLLRKQAQDIGDQVAIEIDGVGSLIYADWDRRSNRLARALLLQPAFRPCLLTNGKIRSLQ